MHILFLSGIVKMDRSDLIFKIMQNIFEDDPGVTLCIDHLIITKWSVLMVVVFFEFTVRSYVSKLHNHDNTRGETYCVTFWYFFPLNIRLVFKVWFVLSDRQIKIADTKLSMTKMIIVEIIVSYALEAWFRTKMQVKLQYHHIFLYNPKHNGRCCAISEYNLHSTSNILLECNNFHSENI